MLEVLAYAEKMRWIDSAEDFIGSRKPRNLLIHEYRSDLLLFLRALESAREAANILFSAISVLEERHHAPQYLPLTLDAK